jgi:hypothetical protein
MLQHHHYNRRHHHQHHPCNTKVQQAQEQDHEVESLQGEQDKDYTSKPPRQETGSNLNTDQKEDETQQQDTGSDVDSKWRHNLDRKQASVSDKEKASSAGVNNNQTKKLQETTNLTQKGPKKI